MPESQRTRAFHGKNVRFVARRRFGFLDVAVLGGFGMLMFLALNGRHPGSLFSFGAILLVRLLGRRTEAGTERSEIRVDDQRIQTVIGRKLYTLPRASIARGWITGEDGPTAHLETDLGDILSVRLPRAAICQDLLDAAGVSVAQRTFSAELGAKTRAAAGVLGFLVAIPAFMVLLSFGASDWSMELRLAASGLLALVLVLLASALAGPTIVVVGLDGVSIERRFGKEFVSFRDLKSIGVADDDVLLRKTDGEVIRLETRATGSTSRDALASRISDALSVYRVRGDHSRSSRLGVLDRSGRTIDAWRDALRALVRGETDYRNSGLGTDDLEEVLSDPKAIPERRIGAALALHDLGDVGSRRKLRVAIETCASPELRVALQRIEEGELDEAAIDEVGTDSPSSRSPSVRRV